MAQPTRSDVHIDAALTDLSVAYIQDEENFIANKVFPEVPVKHQSNKYHTYNKGDFRRDEAAERAPATESAGGGYKMGEATYSCNIIAFHKDVPDQVRDNSDDGVDPDADATEFVSQKFLLQREIKWASQYFTTGIWGTDVVGTTNFTKWDDASSDPEADIDTGKRTVLVNTGYKANTLVVGYDVHLALKRHPLVQDRFKYTSADSITEDMLARYFEIERYMVAEASQNTAQEGATDVNAFIMGDNALLCYSAKSPGLQQPSAGYTFVWSGFTGMNSVGVKMFNFRMQHLAADRVEGEFSYDSKVVASDMGYFFSDATAAA